MGVSTDFPIGDEEQDDEDMMAKKNAISSLGKHIGADSGSSDDGEDATEEPDNDPETQGAVPIFKMRKKSKGGGGGGGMGGMMGGGGGGMDISSMAGMLA